MNRALTTPNYSKVHYWLKKTFGKANHCDHCGKGRKFHWALKVGCIYDFVRENFLQLCTSCHMKYDQTEERRKLNAAAQSRADKSYCWKGVALLDPLTEEVVHTFPNVRGAAKQLQMSHTAIVLNLKGITQTAGGFKWKYTWKNLF